MSALRARLLGARLRGDLERARPRLLRLAWSWCHDRDLAEDLVQDTMERALSRANQLRDHARVDVWLTRILLNLHRDHRRAERDLVAVDEAALAAAESLEEEAQERDLVTRTRRAVAGLKPEHREVITLVDLMELSYAEAAEALEIPVGTVMSRLARGRKQLRGLLEEADAGAADFRLRVVS